MSWLYVLLAALAGAMLPIQAGVNAQLRKALGDASQSALISFAVGTVGLLGYTFVTQAKPIPFSAAAQNPYWIWLGGLVGAGYVTLVIVATPKLGAAVTIGLVVAGQMLVAVLLDHFGWVGFNVHQLTWQRAAGVLLVILGVALIQKF